MPQQPSEELREQIKYEEQELVQMRRAERELREAERLERKAEAEEAQNEGRGNLFGF
jgi:hypothetical protein